MRYLLVLIALLFGCAATDRKDWQHHDPARDFDADWDYCNQIVWGNRAWRNPFVAFKANARIEECLERSRQWRRVKK